MTIPSVTYPLDLSGTSEANLVRAEEHRFPVKKVVAIAPVYGPFYVDSMRVVNTATKQVLSRGRDYIITELHAIPTGLSDKDVAGLLVLKNVPASGGVTLSYQSVGAQYSNSDDDLAAVLNSFNFDQRNPAWPLPVWSVEDTPESVRLMGKGTRFGFEYVVQALDRINASLLAGSAVGYDSVYAYLEANIGLITPDLVERAQLSMRSAIAFHRKERDPHPQYFRRDEKPVYPKVRQPVNRLPAKDETNVVLKATLVSDDYGSIYRVPHKASQFQVSTTEDMKSLVVNETINSPVLTYTLSTTLGVVMRYYWRVRYMNAENEWSDWSNPTVFSTIEGAIRQPSITAPVNGATETALQPGLTSSVFAATKGTDTHASTDWEIWTGPNGTGTLVWSRYNDAVSKMAVSIPSGALTYGTTYHARVQYKGVNMGLSGWSNSIAFTTKIASPAAGTVLKTECEGFDLYNLVSDGNYGSTWILAEEYSAVCGFAPAEIKTPVWATPNNTQQTDRLGAFKAMCSPFQITFGSEQFDNLEWELYLGTQLFKNGFVYDNSEQFILPSAMLTNHTDYRLRVRHNGMKLPSSKWSEWLNFRAEWPNSPAAGTLLDTFCEGYDKYDKRSDGNYGEIKTLLERNAGYCGYVVPFVAKPTIVSPESGRSYGDSYASNGIFFTNSDFAMSGTNPNDSWKSKTYQILSGDATRVIREWTEGGSATAARTTTQDLLDGSWYLVRMRHNSNNGLTSEWSDAISMYMDFTNAGVELSRYCSGTTLVIRVANGDGFFTERPFPNSTDCGYIPPPAAGTDLGTFCQGFNLMRRRADGNGSYYEEVAEYNSASCGYVAPTPRGTELRRYCDGTTLVAVRADGNYGEYPDVLQYNSVDCGYDPIAAPMMPYPNENLNFRGVSDGGASVIFEINPDGTFYGYGVNSATARGRWIPQGSKASDYELYYSPLSAISFPIPPGNSGWYALDRGWLAQANTGSNAAVNPQSGEMEITIRAKSNTNKFVRFRVKLYSESTGV